MKKLKFKVNDVCRVIANICEHEFAIGELVTIVECYTEPDTHYECQNTNTFWFLSEEELELVNNYKMRYLIVTNILLSGQAPFLTDYFSSENDFNEEFEMVVYDLYTNEYTKDGENWHDIEIDHL